MKALYLQIASQMKGNNNNNNNNRSWNTEKDRLEEDADSL